MRIKVEKWGLADGNYRTCLADSDYKLAVQMLLCVPTRHCEEWRSGKAA